MISLERSVFYLLIYLTFFFNIERVDLGQVNIIDISSILYALVLLALLLILAFPVITRLNLPLLLVIWSLFYLFIRFSIARYYPRPIWGGVFTYLTVTELSLSSIGIILMVQVRRHLNDFREAIENLTLAGLTHRIQHKAAAYDDIQKEFLRTRRHEFQLSVLVIQPDPATVKVSINRSVLETQRKMMTRYAVNNIMRLASNLFRRTDLIIDQVIDKDSFAILLTDTDPENAELVAKRFQNLVDQEMGIKISYGLAHFPHEGLTFDELVNKADQNIHKQPGLPGPAGSQMVEQAEVHHP